MKYMLAANYGLGSTNLTSFDKALLNSGVANYNLVKISSILPANAVEMSHVDIPEGSVLFTAFSSFSSNKIDERIASAVGVGIAEDATQIGVIMEYSCSGSRIDAEKMVNEMIVEAMNNRGYAIKEIKMKSAEVQSKGECCVTVFSCLAMWND